MGRLKHRRGYLRVRYELCQGCGLCALKCPRGAITIIWGKAYINPEKCIMCKRCKGSCPFGAIEEFMAPEFFKEEIRELIQWANSLISRLERLQKRDGN